MVYSSEDAVVSKVTTVRQTTSIQVGLQKAAVTAGSGPDVRSVHSPIPRSSSQDLSTRVEFLCSTKLPYRNVFYKDDCDQ